jgi:hypothetical protein
MEGSRRIAESFREETTSSDVDGAARCEKRNERRAALTFGHPAENDDEKNVRGLT